MCEATIQVVHGFGVASVVFRPLLRNLGHGSITASLFRYPSVGLPLLAIVDRLAKDIAISKPTGIVAHSLGCFATIFALQEIDWRGPIVLLAPPFSQIPATRFIPSLLRYPFGPLLDHRSFLSDSKFQLPRLPECCKLTIAGRFDLTVPIHCTRGYPVDDFRIVLHTHNTMLASARVANLCVNWIRNNSTPEALAKSSSVTSK